MLNAGAPILEVKELVVTFRTRGGVVTAVDGLNLVLQAGETLGIVGESGSGKSVSSLAILGLLPPNATVAGSVRLRGREIVGLAERDLRTIRGRSVSLVLQDPMTALNPVFTVGWQIAESVHLASGRRVDARSRVLELLEKVHITAPNDRIRSYPHHLSGGMRQRVVSAMALAGTPEVLIADEPTTSLDATIQAQYLQLLREIQRDTALAIIFITHDFGIVAELCDRVAVMYSGRIVETGSVVDIFDSPAHPYTRGLLGSIPRLGQREPLRSIPGQPPAGNEVHPGCPFAPRCAHADDRCRTLQPPEVAIEPGHSAMCWKAGSSA